MKDRNLAPRGFYGSPGTFLGQEHAIASKHSFVCERARQLENSVIANMDRSPSSHRSHRLQMRKRRSWVLNRICSCRGMRFIVQLLHFTAEDPSMQFSACVGKAYSTVLKPYHGFISSSAFSVCCCMFHQRYELL